MQNSWDTAPELQYLMVTDFITPETIILYFLSFSIFCLSVFLSFCLFDVLSFCLFASPTFFLFVFFLFAFFSFFLFVLLSFFKNSDGTSEGRKDKPNSWDASASLKKKDFHDKLIVQKWSELVTRGKSFKWKAAHHIFYILSDWEEMKQPLRVLLSWCTSYILHFVRLGWNEPTFTGSFIMMEMPRDMKGFVKSATWSRGCWGWWG